MEKRVKEQREKKTGKRTIERKEPKKTGLAEGKTTQYNFVKREVQASLFTFEKNNTIVTLQLV